MRKTATNKTIKGITVEIGADTTQLGKALRGIEQDCSGAKKELSAVEKSLKSAPESAVLWQQKQDLLSASLENSRKKLEILTTAQKSLSQKLADGDIDQKAYDEFQGKIDKARKKLEDLTSQQNDMKKKLAAGEIDQGAYDKFARKIESAKNELGKLESAEKSLEERVKIGDISEEEYRAYQREIENTKAEINRFANKLSDMQSTAKDTANTAENAADSIDEVGEAAADSGEKAEASSGGFSVLKGTIANLAADGIKAAIEGLKELTVETDNALSKLQSSTGATADQMAEYTDIMNDLYSKNYGESKEDIAGAISEVSQQLGDVNSEELEKATENAMLLSDTFDFDVNESIRAAKMLMTQFGITADEAYTLIAQGAQNGLNKNGDLLDTINEYSVHYQQLGYSAEEFFNSLENGAAAGTFSVDKLGDAMKEFGIRTKDTADSTTEGFTLIGLDADDMRQKFAEGGEAAQAATQQTLDALFSLDDQVVQNQAGVDLFGTMWEDLGAEGVKALMDVEGEADKSAETLKDISEIKYDTLESQITSLKRQLRTELLEPLAEKLLPKVKNYRQHRINPQFQTAKKPLPTEKAERGRIILNFHRKGARNQTDGDFLSARYRFANANRI